MAECCRPEAKSLCFFSEDALCPGGSPAAAGDRAPVEQVTKGRQSLAGKADATDSSGWASGAGRLGPVK